jgi:hypothetical protein
LCKLSQPARYSKYNGFCKKKQSPRQLALARTGKITYNQFIKRIGKELFMDDSNSKSEYYISKRAKAEDLKSTAYTFTLVSILGIILLILFLFGVLPIQVADYMKTLMSFVMGGMLLIFLIIGILSFVQLKPLLLAADKEDALLEEITSRFREECSPDRIDSMLSDSAEEPLYFKRYSIMQQLLKEKYPDLEAAFADHIIDMLYSELFSDIDEEKM